MAKITINQIAEELNLSRNTISKVLNQKGGVSEKTEQLVGRECTIYFKQGDGRYTVQVSRDGAMREIDVISEASKSYQTGDKTIIMTYKEGTLYIQ